MNQDDEIQAAFAKQSGLYDPYLAFREGYLAASKQHTMPTFEDFKRWLYAGNTISDETMYDFFASRVKPVVWPSEEEVEALAKQFDEPWDEQGICGMSFGFGVAWIKEKIK